MLKAFSKKSILLIRDFFVAKISFHFKLDLNSLNCSDFQENESIRYVLYSIKTLRLQIKFSPLENLYCRKMADNAFYNLQIWKQTL